MSLKSTNNVETNKYELEIEVSAEQFEEAIQKAYMREKGKINISGFRKGKAPRKLIEREYGEEVFFEQAVNILYPEAVDTAVKESGLEIVARPEVEVTDVSKAEGVKIKATVFTKPEVEVKDYKGIEVEKEVKTVTDEDVDKQADSLREKNARVITVDDRAAEMGDDVVIDFEGFKDGVAFDGGKAEDFTLGLGSGQFIPGFEEQVAGHNIGEEFDINVSFPEDYQEETLAGKAAVFKCTVHEIKQKLVPELDDDFAGDAGFDTVAAYRENVRAELETAKVSEANSAKQDAVLDKVIENATLEIPEAMLETEKRSMLNDYAQRLQSQGLRFDQYLQYTGMTREKMMEQMTPQAESRIRSRLVLEAIAEKENITVSDEDLDSELKTMAEAYALEADKVKEMLGEEGIKQVTDDVRIKKALEFITDAAVEK